LRNAMHGAMTADARGELAGIDVPTLLVWGDQDAMISREDQDGLRKGIRDTQLIVYPDAGHGAHWEEPERFARDLAEFCESVNAATAG
jgi:non-heme chloroperoxidase